MINIGLANVGNVVYAVYVLSLPPGPVWAVHGFYLTSTALMMFWWLRYTRKSHRKQAPTPSDADRGGLIEVEDWSAAAVTPPG